VRLQEWLTYIGTERVADRPKAQEALHAQGLSLTALLKHAAPLTKVSGVS